MKQQKTSENDINEIYTQGLNLNFQRIQQNIMQQKKYQKAISIFEQALRINSNHFQSLCEKGKKEKIYKVNVQQQLFNNSLIKFLEKYSAANDCFSKALQIEPKNVDLILKQSLCLLSIDLEISIMQMEKYSNAKYNIDSALKYEPHNIDLLFNKSLCLKFNNYNFNVKMMKEFDNAFIYLDKAIQIEKKNTQLLLNKSLWLQELQKYDKACEPLDQALQYEPKNIEILFNKSICLNTLDFITIQR